MQFNNQGKMQKELQKYLSEFPGDANGPAQAITPNEQGFHAPAPEMAECKDVKMTKDPLPGDNMAVHSIFLESSRVSFNSKRSM